MDSFFGIGIFELLFILIFALIFLGPERLPGTIRQTIQYYNQFRQIVAELSRELSGEADLLRTFSQEIQQEGEKLMKLGQEPEPQPQPKLSLEHIQSLLQTPDQDTSFDEILRALDAELAVEIAALEARRRQIQELLTQESVDLLKQSGGSSPTLKLLRNHLGEQVNLEEPAASYENNLFAQLDSFLWTLPEYRKQQQDLIQHMTNHPQAWSQLVNIMVRIASLSEAPAERVDVAQLAEEVARLPHQNVIVAEIISPIHLMESPEHLAEVLTGKAAAELSPPQQELFHLVGLRWSHSPDAEMDDYS